VLRVANQQPDLGPVCNAQLAARPKRSHQLGRLEPASEQPQVERRLEAEGGKRQLGIVSTNINCLQSSRNGCVAAELLCGVGNVLGSGCSGVSWTVWGYWGCLGSLSRERQNQQVHHGSDAFSFLFFSFSFIKHATTEILFCFFTLGS
jgi:hypothetical protein